MDSPLILPAFRKVNFGDFGLTPFTPFPFKRIKKDHYVIYALHMREDDIRHSIARDDRKSS